MFSYFKESKPKDHVFSITFYNLDNLFDIYDDPDTFDDDYTPNGDKKWTYRRYKNKLNKISEVLCKIGLEHSKVPPVLIGMAELENEEVLIDLLETKHLAPINYDYVHYDSPDERGVDVSLIYQKAFFELLDSKQYPLYLFDENNVRDYTRDIIYVKGKLNGELLHIIVNHWPSRRSGEAESEKKRIAAAKRVHEIITELKQETENPKIIIMGDFNDEPYNISIKKHLVSDEFFNPMESLKDKGEGTSVYNKEWYLFDQLIFTKNFLEKKPKQNFFKYVDIYDPEKLRTWKGKRKDNPHRTYIGKWYVGGYSDHFPVYAYLEKQED